MILKKFRIKTLVVSILAIMVLSLGGTLAFLEAKTNLVTNAFSSGVVNISIDEEFTGQPITTEGISKKVLVCNDDKNGKLNVVPVYVRVNLVATWVNDDDTVAAIDADSLIEYNFVSDKWSKGEDGYYYYDKILDPGEETEELIDSVRLKEGVDVPEDGHLEVSVLADAVREADKDKWE